MVDIQIQRRTLLLGQKELLYTGQSMTLLIQVYLLSRRRARREEV